MTNYTEEELNFLNRFYKFRFLLIFVPFISALLGGLFVEKNIYSIISLVVFAFYISFALSKIHKVCTILKFNKQKIVLTVLSYICFLGLPYLVFSLISYSNFFLELIALNLFIIYLINHAYMLHFLGFFRKIPNILKLNKVLPSLKEEYFKKDFSDEELNEIYMLNKKIKFFDNISVISGICFPAILWYIFIIIKFHASIYYIHGLYLCLLFSVIYYSLKKLSIYECEIKMLMQNSSNHLFLSKKEEYFRPIWLSIIYFIAMFIFYIDGAQTLISSFCIPFLCLLILSIFYIITLFQEKSKKKGTLSTGEVDNYVYGIFKTSGIVKDGILRTLIYFHNDNDTLLEKYTVNEIKEIATAHHLFCKASCFWQIGFTIFLLSLFNSLSTVHYLIIEKYPLDKIYMLFFILNSAISIYAFILSFCSWRLPSIIMRLYEKLKIRKKIAISAGMILSLPLFLMFIFAVSLIISLISDNYDFQSLIYLSGIIALISCCTTGFGYSLSKRASVILESHGLEVGFFGVSKNDLEKLLSLQENAADTSTLNAEPEKSKPSNETGVTQYEE